MRFVHTILLVVFLLFSLAMPAMGEEVTSYLCIPDASTGFKRNESGKWVATKFDVQGQRFLLSKNEGKWLWKKFGQSVPDSLVDCGVFNEHAFIRCNVAGSQITFSKHTLRFMEFHPFGYVTSDIEAFKDYNLTPLITIGTCTPL